MSDPRLLTWGRRMAAGRRSRLPTLWLFTDTARLPDPRPAALRLPAGISGIVLRHDRHPDRAAIGRDLARICRARRLVLVVAGDVRLAAALGAGVHLRSGRWPSPVRPRHRCAVITSSAHTVADLHRARVNGATLAFLSPVFPTLSHPGEPALGAVRWLRLARAARLTVAALGGLDGRNIGRLPGCAAAAAISALA